MSQAAAGKASLIPQEFLTELLHRVDIVELIDHYVPLKKRGMSFLACCPFHNEKTPSFNVIPRKQFYHCFGCGSSGNAIGFVMSYLNQGFVDAVTTLASRLGMTVPREISSEKIQAKQSLYQLLEEVTLWYQNNLKHSGKEAVDYLRQRGLNGSIAKQFQLGYAPQAWHSLENQFKNKMPQLMEAGMLVEKENSKGNVYDRYRHRIMFPIHDRQGRIIGFGGRAIGSEEKPKYLNSPETSIFQKNRELYGLHQVLQQRPQPEAILVVEGYLDVIALAQFGINNAVATLGTASNAGHIQILGKYCKQLLFCFDGDVAGKKAAWKALENSLAHLDNDLDLRFVFLPDNQDPDTLIRSQGVDAFMSYIQAAVPLHQYLLDNLTENIDLHSLNGKSRLINKAKPILQAMPEGSYKQLLIEELSRLTHIENHRLLQMIANKQPHRPLQAATALSSPRTRLIKRTPNRLAIAMLLQHPDIYGQCKKSLNMEGLNGREQNILRTLLSYIEQNPGINTAALTEFFRDTTYFDALVALTNWDLHIPEEGLVKEFTDTCLLLQKQNLEKQINYYRTKLSKQGLTAAEKQILQELLQKKHKIT